MNFVIKSTIYIKFSVYLKKYINSMMNLLHSQNSHANCLMGIL